ncbi:unnamed protein product [Closterium sp. NIES-54]
MSSTVLSLTRPAAAHGHRLLPPRDSRFQNSCSNSVSTVVSPSRVPPSASRFAHLRSSESQARSVTLGGARISSLHSQRRSRLRALPGGSESTTTVAEEKENGVGVRASEDQQRPSHDSDQSGSPKADAPPSSPPPPSSMKSLDAYFAKLNGSSSSSSSSSGEKQTQEQQTAEAVAAPAAAAASAETAASPAASATSTASSATADTSSSAEKKKGTKDFQALSSLNSYFDKLNAGKEKKADAAAPAASQAPAAASSTAQADVSSKGGEADKTEKAEKVLKVEESGGSKELKAEEVEELIRRIVEDVEKKKGSGALDSKVSDLTLEAIMGPRNLLDDWISAKAAVSAPTAVYTLVAINIAVFLFELASPEAVPGVITTSLPALLAAKVNPLIEAGEWWRLLTPSLLHAGIIHLSVGTFFLLGLGSVLEFAIGPLGLLAVYFSSGLAGNITSFLQTPDVTVGGTGPVYGVAAAYAAFLIKNREVIGTETADSNVRESLIIAALFALFANPLPIDPSTHAGAALAGFLFGSIAAPSMRKVKISNEEAAKRQQGLLNSLLSQKTNEDSYELVVEPADSKKLAAAFGASMALSLVLFQLSQGIILDDDLLQSLSSVDGDVWL